MAIKQLPYLYSIKFVSALKLGGIFDVKGTVLKFVWKVMVYSTYF